VWGSPDKYFGSERDGQGNKLYWSHHTSEPYPFRGTPQFIRDHELDKLVVTADAHAEILLLPKDLSRYIEVLDLCANGLGTLRKEEHGSWTPDGNLPVFLQWFQFYNEMPKSQPFEVVRNDVPDAYGKPHFVRFRPN
jgi:hypothetical protein